MTKTGALAEQHGGTHYKHFKVEPVEFVMVNDWDFCAASLLKYIARHKFKNGLADIEKAGHYVRLRAQLWRYTNHPQVYHVGIHQPNITMAVFLSANNINTGSPEGRILLTLETWVHNNDIADDCIMHINANLTVLMRTYKDGYDSE